MTLTQIWLHTAEVYIGIGKPTEATTCTQEAANFFPMSHNVLYIYVARLLQGNIDETQWWYEEDLYISPTHMKNMQLILHQLGYYSLVEKIFQHTDELNGP